MKNISEYFSFLNKQDMSPEGYRDCRYLAKMQDSRIIAELTPSQLHKENLDTLTLGNHIHCVYGGNDSKGFLDIIDFKDLATQRPLSSYGISIRTDGAGRNVRKSQKFDSYNIGSMQ